MALSVTDMADMVATTHADFGPMRFQQIAQSLASYEVFSRWFKKDKVSFQSGSSIKRTLMTSFNSGAAAHVSLDHIDEVTTPNTLAIMDVPWRYAQAQWAIWYKTDVLMNRGQSLILNIMEPRRLEALLALVEELETRAWAAAPAVANTTLPYGVQYWIVENTTTGFNGGLPSDHTTVGGIVPATHTNFRNYTAAYVTVNKADLIKKMRTAHRAIRFKSPVTVSDYRAGLSDRYRIYTNEVVISNLEDIGEGQLENVGRDLAEMDGTMTFRRHPIINVPELAARSDNPIYMLDHTTFYPACLAGDYLRETPPSVAKSQHNVYQVFVDLTYNFLCVDRRRNAVFSVT